MGTKNSDPAKESKETKKSILTEPWAKVLAAVIAGIFLVITTWMVKPDPVPPDTPPLANSKITSPSQDEEVSTPIRVEGTLRGIPEDHYVWLAVQVGNLQWPKEEINRGDQEWQKFINENEEAGKRFSIVLLKVDRDGHASIQSWINDGNRTRSYPGFEKVPGSEILDVVRVHFK